VRACLYICVRQPSANPPLRHLSQVNLSKPNDQFSRDMNCILLSANQMYSNLVLSNNDMPKALIFELGAKLDVGWSTD